MPAQAPPPPPPTHAPPPPTLKASPPPSTIPATPDLPADTERIGDEIAELAAHIHAATYRLLELLVEFDRGEGWGGGFRSCAHWLSWRTGIALGAAREKVRVARALPQLPKISSRMRVGAFSYSKVRALTRVATPDNEADLLEFARHGTTAHVERLVRAWREVDRNEAVELDQARHEARSLTVYQDEDGSWVVRGRLDPAVGALLRKALEAAATELYARAADRDAHAEAAAGSEGASHGQRLADAIGLVAERALASREATRRAERYQVVVHTGPLGVLGGGPDDIHVSAETFRRLSCDGTVVEMRHDEEGGVLDVGRRARTVPPALRRALEFRDSGCRFPGCGVRHTDAHHIRHWADGGETSLDNLVLLCRHHHRAVHEGAVRLELAEDGKFRFMAPRYGRWVVLPGSAPPGVSAPRLDTEDSARPLRISNRARGVHPDAWTPTPRWAGEPLDVGFAIDVLRKPEGASDSAA
ncbi:MAG: DUF222 domain-containing protein [Gemmatimonadota bacterium]